jgi:alpha-galactosidase
MTVNDQDILTNKALIAVNQDTSGKQGFKIEDFGHFEIWQKPLSNGDIALCFFNRDTNNKKYKIDWEKIRIKDFSGEYTVQNLWNHKTI